MPAPTTLVSHVGKENEHVLQYWDELNEEERAALSNQILSIDIDECKSAFDASSLISPPSPTDLSPLDDNRHIVVEDLEKNEKERLLFKGLEAISKGEVAALVLAGGQASRLGSDKPKGMMPLSLHASSVDSLLGLQGAKLSRLQELAALHFPTSVPCIPWLIMTSKTTEALTKEHVKEVAKASNLKSDQITIFSQWNMPAFDMEGRLILAEKGELSTAPNGNGGLYSALAPHLDNLKAKGVKYIHVYCVDNILVKVADPLMIGIAIDRESDCMAKVVKKVDPEEKVGVICMKNGLTTVVEYSELCDLSFRSLPDGRLEYRAGNIANHLFSLSFLQSFCSSSFHLPYHRALKKIAYVDKDGQLVKPCSPNGIKLEQFVFDVFEKSSNFYMMEVIREQEFSPLKNADSVGTECLSTCRRDLHRLHSKWLREAGVDVDEEAKVLVSPSKSYDGENLDEYKDIPVSENLIIQ